MRDVYLLGAGMTRFAKHPDRTVRSLAEEAVGTALTDAGVAPGEVERVYFGNAAGGLVTGQETIRGQAALRESGLLGVPIVNVENACASGSTAAHLAIRDVGFGAADCAIAVGAERMSHPDKAVSFRAFASGVDLDEEVGLDIAEDRLGMAAGTGGRSRFMDLYAEEAQKFMAHSGATQADLAAVVVKSRAFGSLNPKAQFQRAVTEDQVLAEREIVWPLTLSMCSPIGDGAAAVAFGSRQLVERLGLAPIRIRASVLTSGTLQPPYGVERAIRRAYDEAGVDPGDLDVVELHDAAAPAELEYYSALGLCAAGEEAGYLRSGATSLAGKTYVNPSGGLLSKGHPVGATGCAQLVELAEQLRGRAGARQRSGARLAMAHNGGGSIGPDAAAVAITIAERM